MTVVREVIRGDYGRGPHSPDWYQQRLFGLLARRLTIRVSGLITVDFLRYRGVDVCVVDVKRSPTEPVRAQRLARTGYEQHDKSEWAFWVREGNRTVEYRDGAMTSYIKRRWPNT